MKGGNSSPCVFHMLCGYCHNLFDTISLPYLNSSLGRPAKEFLHTEKCYRWFSWGMASLPEGKSRGMYSVQLCAKYRQGSTTLSQCCFSQGKWSAVQLPLDHAFALRK